MDHGRAQSRKLASHAERIVIVSRHDYRTLRRASGHFLADAFARQGHDVKFVSVGYSFLSRMRADSRTRFEPEANEWCRIGDVDCLLWKTLIHPVDIGANHVRTLTGYAYDLWSHWPSDLFDEAIGNADIVIVESGIGVAFLRRIRRLSPRALICYRAADLLAVAKVHPRVQRLLERDIALVDLVVAVGRTMVDHFQRLGVPCVFLPHGIETKAFERSHPNPFPSRGNSVSVGSMLFDRTVIEILAEAYPHIVFHLIGCNATGTFQQNVRVYDETSFAETLPYLQHADVGLAPYSAVADCGYLADSSLKLTQFGHLGLPAVCPDFAVGDHPLRFGYQIGTPASIVAAFAEAIGAGEHAVPSPALDWDVVALKFVEHLRAAPRAARR